MARYVELRTSGTAAHRVLLDLDEVACVEAMGADDGFSVTLKGGRVLSYGKEELTFQGFVDAMVAVGQTLAEPMTRAPRPIDTREVREVPGQSDRRPAGAPA